VGRPGHILQLLVCSGHKGVGGDLHAKIVAALEKTRPHGGIMHDDLHDERGRWEIRLLSGLELPTIREIEKAGFRVRQIG